jgi:FMN phosphatase YigB (HAD superfamily)
VLGVDRVKAVLFDAMGTLLTLRDPAPELARRLGIGEDEARRGLRDEISYYRAHHLEGRDEASLLELRQRCAGALGLPGFERDELLEALLGSIGFEADPAAARVLEGLRADGLRTVAVSNWDVSLPDALAEVGLADLLDGVVSSAEVGAAKPDPRPFRRALEIAGAEPGEAVHVGDREEEDVAGARAAGIRPLLLGRDLASLDELSKVLNTAP